MRKKSFKKGIALFVSFVILFGMAFSGTPAFADEGGEGLKNDPVAAAGADGNSADTAAKDLETEVPLETPASSENSGLSEATESSNKPNPSKKLEPLKETGNRGGMKRVMVVGPEATTHTYIFKVDGVEVERQIVKNNEYLKEPEAPEKANHKFLGWFDESNNPIDFSQPISVTPTEPPSDTEFIVNAKFEPIFYVDFIYNNKILKTKSVAPNGTVDASGVPLNVTEPGKVFSHWSETENGTTAFDFSTQITENKTLYAVTKDAWIVTFDSHGGSAVLPKYVDHGGQIELPENPTRAGYTFKHWSLLEGGVAIPSGYTVTENITLHAVWTPANTPYKVIYWRENAEDDGYTFEEVVYKTGTTGATATYDSKSYTGFHFGSAETKTISANGDTVVNVYYKRNVHTFKIEYRTGSWPPYTWHTFSTTQLKYGQSTATQYNAAVAAYPNYRWHIARDSSISYSEAPAMPNKDLTVHGKYAGTYKYTIAYVEKGTTNEIKDRYVFYGQWGLSFTDEDGIDIPGFTVTPRSQWDSLAAGQVSRIFYTRNNYTLTFNKNNGDAPLVVSSIPFDSDISNKDTTGLNENSTFVINGVTHYFAGWYDNSACEGTPYSLAGKKMPAHNLALYAKWTPEKYTVTFYKTLNEGDGVFHTEENITPLHTISQPAGNPPGTDFIGWYWYLNGYFVKFDFETPISGNFKLYPVFGSQTAQVTYNANGGTGTAPVDNNNYLIGAEATVKSSAGLTAPSNKVFLGWNTAANGSGTLYMPNSVISVPTGGVTLYAQWGDINTGTFITYDANGGTGGPTTIALANNATHIIIENTFTRSGYDFTGWNSNADGTGTSFSAGDKVTVDRINQETENILYAQWTRSLKDVVATKNWVGGHAVDHTRVVIDLYRTPAGGTEEKVTQEPVVTPSSGTHDTFTHTWENLPTHTEQGALYTYRVAEPTVHSSYTAVVTGSGYDFTVTNTYHNAKNVEAKKYWRGVSGTSDKVAVWFTLYRTTETGTDERVPGLNPEKIPPGNDSAHWNNLLGEDEQGNAYTFYVKETDKNGNDWTPTGFEKEEAGLSVYNYKLTVEDVKGIKKWVGGPTPRPAVSLELWRKGGTAGENGEKVEEATLVVNGEANFGKQRLTDINDVPYTYYVLEPDVPDNYEVSYNGLTATNTYKNTSAVTLKAPSASKTYDGIALTKTEGVTAEGLPEGFTVEATASGSQTDVGSTANVVDDYVIKDGNGVDQTTYFTNVTKVPGTLKVTKAPVTIKTGSAEKEYDGSALTNAEASITGLVNNETATVTATGSQTAVGSSTNTYSIDWGNTDSNNYAITEELGTLEVTKNETTEVKLIAADAEKVYDGTPLSKTDGVTWEGLPAGFTVEATSTGSQTDAGSSDNVVNDGYVIKDGNGIDQTENFTNVTKVPGTLKVTKAPVTIKTGSAEKEYDGSALTNAEASITGLVNNETATVTATGSQTAVGSSTNTYSIDWGNTDSNNYAITEELGTLEVTKNETTEVKLIAADAEKVYDGTPLSKTDGVTWEGLPAGFTVEATSSGSRTDVGVSDNVVNDGYVIKDGNGIDQTENFTNVTKVPGTLKVTKAPVTIKTGSAEKEYDGSALTNAEASITGLVNNETATVTATGSQTAVGSSTNTYSIDWGNTDSNNYAITEELGTLEVTKNETTEVKLIAADAEKVYDGTPLSKTDGVTWEGLPAGFTVEATSSGSRTDVGVSDNVVNDGYVIKDGNGIDQTANFTNVTKVKGTLKIKKRAITVKVEDAPDVEYDGTEHTGETEYTFSNVVPGQEATITYNPAKGTPVDTYTGSYGDDLKVMASGVDVTANYDLTDKTPGKLTITKNSTLEVKLKAASAEKVYDGTPLEKTDDVTWEGLPEGFTVEATSSGSRTDVGVSANVVDESYVIKDGNGDDQTENFTNVEKVDGTLTVTRKPVTVKADDKTKEYGDPDPELTATVSGLLGDDTVVYTLSREAGEEVGSYFITPEGDEEQGNYLVLYETGIFDITEVSDEHTVSVKVTKVWNDSNNKAGKRPARVTIKLLANGKDTGKRLVLTAANKWEGYFDGLESHIDGKEVVYTIKEIPVKGYKALITKDKTVTDPAELGYIVKNTYKGTSPDSIPTTGESIGYYPWMGALLLVLAAGTLLISRKKRESK